MEDLKKPETLDYRAESPINYRGTTLPPEQHIKTGCAVKSHITIIDEIEDILSIANEKMYELPIHPVRSKAIEEIDVLRRVTINSELRKAFE